MTPVRTRRTQAIANRSGGGKYTESLELRQMLSAVVPIGVNGKTFDRTPTITWSADAGAVSYEIWVSQLGENQSAVLVKSGIVSTSYTVAPADLGALQQLNAQTHRVWVRSYPAAGAPSAWSAPVDFTVTTDRPLVTAPLSSGVNTLLQTPSPVLSWTNVSGASVYSVQVDNLTTGVAGVFVDNSVSQLSRTLTGLSWGNAYRAWVRGVSNDGSFSVSSVPFDFSVQTQPAVTPLAFTSPLSNASTFDATPTITWNAVSGAVSYNLQISQYDTGWTTVKVVSGIPGNLYSVTAADIAPLTQLSPLKHRIWVQSVNSAGTVSAWGPLSEFFVTTDKPTITGPVPSGTPAVVNSNSPSLQWSATPGAQRYVVWVNDLTTSTVKVVYDTSVTGTSLTLPGLDFGHGYRAWVQAISNDGTLSAWSASYDFTIRNVPVTPQITSSASIASVTAGHTISWTNTGAHHYVLHINDITAPNNQIDKAFYEPDLTTTSFQPGLVPGRKYRVWVRSVMESGAVSVWSSPVDLTRLDAAWTQSADLDGDGRSDTLEFVSSTGTWVAGLTRPLGVTQFVATSLGTQNPWQNHAIGDFNGDGRKDLAVRNTTTGEWRVSVFTGTSFHTSASGWGTWAPASAITNLTVGDFTGDGQDDIAARTNTGAWQVAVSNGTGFETSPPSNWGTAASDLATTEAVDVNRDGKVDIVGRTTNDQFKVALSTGTTFNFGAALWNTNSGSSFFVPTSGPVNYFEKLDKAIAAFEFVRNNVKYQPYYGAMKGWQAAKETLTANAWDQSALLIKLLTDAGIEGRYSIGTVTVTGPALNDLQDWLGVKSFSAAVNVLSTAGLLISTAVVPGTVSQSVTFRHAWVEAWLPGKTSLGWQKLDPSWKFREFQPGLLIPAQSGPGTQPLLEKIPFDQTAFFSPVAQTLTQNFNKDVVSGNIRSNTTYLGERLEEVTGDFQITGQKLVGGLTGDHLALLNGPASRTQVIEAQVNVPAGKAAGLITRYSRNTAGNTQYYLTEVDTVASPARVALYRVTNGVRTQLGTVVTLPSSTGVLKLDVVLDRLRVSFAGVLRIDLVDTLPITSAGRMGVLAKGVAEIDDLKTDWTESQDERPVEFYKDQVLAWLSVNRPNLSLADVAYDGPIVAARFVSIPPPPPSYAIASETAVTAVPLTLLPSTPIETHRVRIKLQSGSTVLFSHLLSVPEVSLKRITIAYVPVSGGLRAELAIDGVALVYSGSPTVVSGTAVTLTLEHFNTGTADTGSPNKSFSFTRKAGQYHAIGLDAGQYAPEALRRFRAIVNDANLTLKNADPTGTTLPTTPDTTSNGMTLRGAISSTLPLAMANYFSQLTDQRSSLALLTGAVNILSAVGSGIASSDAVVAYQNGFQIFAMPKELGVDIPNNLFNAQAINGESVDAANRRFRIAGFEGSALEHSVIEEMVSIESVSTVRGLQWALDNGIQVFEFEKVGSTILDRRNNDAVVTSVVTALGLTSSSAETEIQTLVNAFKVVTVPKYNVHMNDWDGVVYTSETLGSGGAVTEILYAINEMSGGYSTGNWANPVTYNTSNFPTSLQPFSGDPVSVGTGTMFRDDIDFSLPNIGLPLTFSRHYDTRITEDAGFGVGWMFSFGDLLKFEGPGNSNTKVTWLNSSGTRLTFHNDAIVNGNTDYYDVPALFAGGQFSYALDTLKYTAKDKHGMTWVFDSTGKLLEMSERNGNKLVVGYVNGKISTVSNPQDPVAKLTFAYPSATTQTVTAFGGRVWTYTLQTLASKKYLQKVESPSDAATTMTTQFEYVPEAGPLQGFLKIITEPNGGQHTYSYYPNGRSFEVTDALSFKTHATYDLFDNSSTFTDERGIATSYRHNEFGFLVRQYEPDGTSDTLEWNVDRQLQTTEKDAFGFTERYEYDAKSNLSKLTERDGVFTKFEYDPTYSQVSKVTVDPDGVQNSDDRVTQYVVGANGNITDIIDALGNRTRLTYKTNGLLETRTTPKGNLAYPTIDNNYTSTFTYNTLGLLETDTGPDPDGSGPLSRPVQSSGFNPLGQLTSTTDATGVITIYVPDLLGRILSETLPDPDGTGPLGQLVTTFKYTTAGDIQSITDPLGGKRSFIYDAKRQKVSEVNADGTTKAFQYDAHGNGITVIDELGREDRTIFDTRNRPIASLAPFDVQTSDSALSATRFDATGRTIATTDANGNTTIFTYDPMGRLLTTTDAMGFSAGNLYDDYGNVVTTTDRRGEQAIFECDVLNRLTEVRRPIFATGTTTVTGYYSISTNDYDPNGNLTKQIEYDLTGLALASIPADPRTLAASKQ